jgi:hypothetical protein
MGYKQSLQFGPWMVCLAIWDRTLRGPTTACAPLASRAMDNIPMDV